MKTTMTIATLILIASTLAAPAALVNSHGQTIPPARKSAPAPTCCYTKITTARLPTGGIIVQTRQACVPGCDKPCLASQR